MSRTELLARILTAVVVGFSCRRASERARPVPTVEVADSAPAPGPDAASRVLRVAGGHFDALDSDGSRLFARRDDSAWFEILHSGAVVRENAVTDRNRVRTEFLPDGRAQLVANDSSGVARSVFSAPRSLEILRSGSSIAVVASYAEYGNATSIGEIIRVNIDSGKKELITSSPFLFAATADASNIYFIEDWREPKIFRVPISGGPRIPLPTPGLVGTLFVRGPWLYHLYMTTHSMRRAPTAGNAPFELFAYLDLSDLALPDGLSVRDNEVCWICANAIGGVAPKVRCASDVGASELALPTLPERLVTTRHHFLIATASELLLVRR